MTVGPSAAATRSGSPRPQQHRERHPPDVARRRRVGRVEVAVRVEPGDGVDGRPVAPHAGRPSRRRGRVQSPPRTSRRASARPPRRQRRRHEVALPRQELADRRPVLGSRIRVRPEPVARSARSPSSWIGDPASPGRSRNPVDQSRAPRIPAGASSIPDRMTTERRRDTDDRDWRMPSSSMVPHHRGMRIADFALERYFAQWEFAVEHLLCASDVEGYPMSELLALADTETRALWKGLRLGYTESTGHPLLRREIAATYETIEPDDVLTFAGAEEAIFCLMNVLVGPGDHVIVTWPGYQSLYEVARATGAEISLHGLHESDGWAIDIDRLRVRAPADHPPHRRQHAAQPDRDDGRPDDVRRAARDRQGRRHPAVHGRGLSRPRIRRDRPARRRRRRPPDRDLARGHVEGVRAGRPADRLDRDARPRPAGSPRGVQGLHDDLLVGAVGDPRDHRVARPRSRSSIARAGSSPRTSSSSTGSSRTTSTGSPGSARAAGRSGSRG